MKFALFSVLDHHPHLPRSVGQFYDELIGQTVLAERLGYHAALFAEHHFHEYGALPSPAVFLAAVARQTRKILLGPAVAILPLHDPRTVAEDYAVVDNVSDGRLVFGVGSGYLKHEFVGYGRDLANKAERFNDGLAIIRRLWRGEAVTAHGRHYQLDRVRLNVVPLQREVPVFIAALRKEVAIHVGRQGVGLLSIPYGSLSTIAETPDFVAQFNHGRRESGARPMPHGLAPHICSFHTHVAQSDKEAEAIAKGPLELYCKTRLYAKPFTYQSIVDSGLALFGSVDTVADRLVTLAGMGVNYVSTLHNFGAMPDDAARNSMRLFAQEVIPRVARRLAA
jgi:alkanesulfonate monooxygenase SsuD/methylene tetrahydromethanopterin reductase-like flavin-dependent oxidoreductase (luciferase family)